MNGLRRLRMAVALGLGACAAAVLLSACGGGADESGSTRAPATTADDSVQVEGASKPEEKAEGTAPSQRRHPEGEAEAKQGGEGEKGGSKADKGSKDSPTRVSTPRGGDPSGCSRSTKTKRCAEVGEAYEQAKKGGSRVVSPDECPAGLGGEVCKEVNEALERGESRVVEPDECPPAMTDQQCAEAGRAYQEATK